MNCTISKSVAGFYRYSTALPHNTITDKVTLAFHQHGRDVMHYMKENGYTPVFDRSISDNEMLSILLGIV